MWPSLVSSLTESHSSADQWTTGEHDTTIPTRLIRWRYIFPWLQILVVTESPGFPVASLSSWILLRSFSEMPHLRRRRKGGVDETHAIQSIAWKHQTQLEHLVGKQYIDRLTQFVALNTVNVLMSWFYKFSSAARWEYAMGNPKSWVKSWECERFTLLHQNWSRRTCNLTQNWVTLELSALRPCSGVHTPWFLCNQLATTSVFHFQVMSSLTSYFCLEAWWTLYTREINTM